MVVNWRSPIKRVKTRVSHRDKACSHKHYVASDKTYIEPYIRERRSHLFVTTQAC